jgi:hypothetical protein
MPPLRAPPLTVYYIQYLLRAWGEYTGKCIMHSPGLCVTGDQRREEEQRGPIMHACASDLLPGALMAQAHAARLRLPCTAAPAGPGAGRADDNSCRTTHCRATLHYKGRPEPCQWGGASGGQRTDKAGIMVQRRTEDRQGWQKKRGKATEQHKANARLFI